MSARCLIIVLPLILLAAGCKRKNAFPDTPYRQPVRYDIRLPGEAGEEVMRLLMVKGAPVAVTRTGAFIYLNENWAPLFAGTELLGAAGDSDEGLWLLTRNAILPVEDAPEIKLPPETAGDSLLCLLREPDHVFYLGTSSGLYTWNGAWLRVPELKGLRINDVVSDSEGIVWLATSDGLWQQNNGKWINLDEALMAVGNERKYYALATANDGADLLFSAPQSLGLIAKNGDHRVWRGPDGLPYGPARAIRTFGDEIWLATDKGAIHKDSSWHYYHGRRWLPDEHVTDILQVRPGVVWIATAGGISEIRQPEMTLARKAMLYEDIIEKRHNRRGLINISRLAVPGDLSTSFTRNEDNDGLWTSCYLAAECFRFAATKDEDAKAKAIRTFEALERLEAVTGIAGYPARSYAPASDSVVQSQSPHPKKWHLSPDGKWQWLDDTSSDEITGHIYTLSLFYELVADENQKQRVVQLIDRIVTHIIDNDFHLIDFDGKPTRWGVWHPDSLNHSPNWAFEKGLNSLQVLSFLKTAHHLTGSSRYEDVYRKLINEHGYARNAVRAKIYGPFETSHSDDILNFFPYYGLLQYAGNDPYRDLYVKSLERSWKAVANNRMPAWNVIASSLLQKDCGLEAAREELRQYPLDLVDWSMENSHRWDIPIDPLADRFGKRQALYPVRTAESSVSRWNTNPKLLDSGRRGETEETGSYFLFAYWMGRYYGFFGE
ncbi:MAG: transcriptional regulator [Cytophagaceae bacterium SCN 52-12]|nr:MAG: transcriptional regulator [Cytophagaceae bacterium SCN 52-12]